MAIKVTYDPTPLEINNRTVLPIKATSMCPLCKESEELNLMEEHLNRLILNEPFSIPFWHPGYENGTTDCAHEWEEKVVLKVGLFQARAACYEGYQAPKDKIRVIIALRKKTGCGLKAAKDWVESPPKYINEELAAHLEIFGANITWNY